MFGKTTKPNVFHLGAEKCNIIFQIKQVEGIIHKSSNLISRSQLAYLSQSVQKIRVDAGVQVS